MVANFCCSWWNRKRFVHTQPLTVGLFCVGAFLGDVQARQNEMAVGSFQLVLPQARRTGVAIARLKPDVRVKLAVITYPR